MTKLYVIGNGFDLWHNLPTKYAQFYEYAKETLGQIETYYSLPIAQANPWCDFENSLGAFDWKVFYGDHNQIDFQSEDFRPSFVHGLEDDLSEQADRHVDAIRECFHGWISGIDISVATNRLALSTDARFLTFNYTSTLQSVYGIKDSKVLHIHGRTENDDELVFGHGESIEEDPEVEENGDSNRTVFSDAEQAAKYPFYALKKPVDEVLNKNQNFFDSLAGTLEIIVIGHSLNKIDIPYFKNLAAQSPNAKWTVCLHGGAENEHHVQVLTKLGVPTNQINLCTYEAMELAGHHARA